MASGNHVCSGNWPDLPTIASINAAAHHKMSVWPTFALGFVTAEFSATMLNEPTPVARCTMKNVMITPVSKPISPVRVVRNAFSAASLFGFSSHQWPMSTNEHMPTSSQPTRSSSVLSATTSSNIDAVKSERKA